MECQPTSTPSIPRGQGDLLHRSQLPRRRRHSQGNAGRATTPLWPTPRPHMPDFRNLPGVPVKIEMDAQNRHIVMTLVSIKRDPIPDAEFVVPSDYSEMKMPEIFGGRKTPKTPEQVPVGPVPKPTP